MIYSSHKFRLIARGYRKRQSGHHLAKALKP
jgi:hypothetical protein